MTLALEIVLQYSLETKKFLQTLAMVAELNPDMSQLEAECYVANLASRNCRMGCLNCGLNELFDKLVTYTEAMVYDPGNSTYSYSAEDENYPN